MNVFYSDTFAFPLAGSVPAHDLLIPEPATDEHLLRGHDPDYVRRVTEGGLSIQEIRRIGLP